MAGLQEFSTLVATLYEAAADPDRWGHFVVQFYEAMESTRGVLTAIAEQPGRTMGFLEGYTDSEISNYRQYFHQHDSVLTAGLRSIEKNSHWIGPLEEIYSYRDLEATEIYNDYYRDLDMHYASCVMVGPTGPYSALGMAAWRPKSSGPYSPEQLRLVELLTPHLKQAFALQAKLDTLGMQAQAFQSALEIAAVAVIALGADSSILTASPPAEAALAAGNVLIRRGGRLRAINAERDAALQRLIDRAIRTSGLDLIECGGRATLPGGAVLLPSPNGGSPLQVQVLPVRASRSHIGLGPAALVFISDPGAVLPSRSQTMRNLYQLSPLEARLVDLFLQGIELKQAAEVLALTYDAARFHLKHVFRKTHTTRQVELLRLLLSIPA